jgi:hypothetical protein
MEFNGFKVDIEEKSQIIDLENQDFNFMMMISWSKPKPSLKIGSLNKAFLF